MSAEVRVSHNVLFRADGHRDKRSSNLSNLNIVNNKIAQNK